MTEVRVSPPEPESITQTQELLEIARKVVEPEHMVTISNLLRAAFIAGETIGLEKGFARWGVAK